MKAKQSKFHTALHTMQLKEKVNLSNKNTTIQSKVVSEMNHNRTRTAAKKFKKIK